MGRKKKEEETETSGGISLDRIIKGKKYDTAREALVEAKDVVKFKDRISTGSIILDSYLEGGYRCGVSKFSGPKEHGKSRNALEWARNWQLQIDNGCVLYIPSEGRLTDEMIEASKIDTDPSKFRVFRTNVYEDVCNLIFDAVTDNPEGTRYFMVIDSVNAMVTKADLEKNFHESNTVAGGARLSSTFNQKTAINIGSRGHHLMYLVQPRANMGGRTVGSSGTTDESGGSALGFYNSLEGKINKLWTDLYFWEDDDKNKPPIGHYFSVKFTKSFHDKSQTTIKIPIKHGRGIWLEREVFDLLMMYGQLNRNGSWFEAADTAMENGLPQKLQGEKKVVQFLEETPEVTKKLESYFRETLIGK